MSIRASLVRLVMRLTVKRQIHKENGLEPAALRLASEQRRLINAPVAVAGPKAARLRKSRPMA